MTPYEVARQAYEAAPGKRTFDEDLRLHLLNGYVICRPDFFIMGRHVDSKAPAGLIVNPEWLFHPDSCDCWHIALFAGDIAPAFEILPWPLPRLSFERKGDLRFYPLASIRRLSGGMHATLGGQPS